MNYFNYFSKTLVCLLVLITLLNGSIAQPSQLKYGQAVVTCFSGHVNNAWNQPIENNYVLGVIDIRNHATAPLGSVTNWMPPMFHPATADSVGWKSDSLGQVFGTAIDDDGNIYVASSTVYGNYPSGNAGSGGIYKIDANTWQASPFVTTLPSPSGTVVGTAQLPNVRTGLGNICFDPNHMQFFVTNHEDGKIYRIDKTTGIVLSVFDPMTLDNGAIFFAPKGERLWGIAYHNTENRVYYAVWAEDERDNTPNTLFNTIRSVALDPAGDFITSTDQLEITLPPRAAGGNHSNPVSDIAFSTDGRMLLAEHGMIGDVGDQSQTGFTAHRARLLEYLGGMGTWTPTPAGVTKFSVGTNARNCSGGTDFGYESFDIAVQGPSICDSMVWSTGDALHPTAPTTWYGAQGMRAGGGTPANSIVIDLDGVPFLIRKTQYGDLEIFDECYRADPCSNLNIQADFTYTQPSVGNPTISVTDVSTVGGGTVAFIDWCFPDTVITQGPGGSTNYTYDSTGTFQVCLKTYAFTIDAAGNSVCCKDEFCVDFFVPKDTCDYHNAQMACVQDSLDPYTYTFTDSTLNGDRTIWTIDTAGAQANFFGQGLGHTVTYTFPGSGVYTVCMVSFWHVDSVVCCLDTVYKTVYIRRVNNPCDTLSMTINSQNLPIANGVAFTPNSNFPLHQVCWDFNAPGGITDTTMGAASITHFFSGSGTYNVCAVAKWMLPTGILCTDTVCIQVIIPPTPSPCVNPFANFTISQQPGSNSISVLDNSVGGDLSEWDFDAPSGVDLVTGGTGSTGGHTYTSPGVYTVCLYSTWYYDPTDSTRFCRDTVCSLVTVIPQTNPCVTHTAQMTLNQLQGGSVILVQDISSNGDVSEWDFDAPSGIDVVTGGTGSSAGNLYTSPGLYTVCLYSTWYYDPNDSTRFCKDTVCALVTVPATAKPNLKVDLAPNPVLTELTIEYPPTPGQKVNIRLLSAQGIAKQTLQADGSGTTQMDLSSVEKGMYILEVRSETYRLTKKVIKR